MDVMEISVAAIHEAGHAVVAAYLRLSFSRVTITPGKDDGGHIMVPGRIRTYKTLIRVRGSFSFRQRSTANLQNSMRRQNQRRLEKGAVMLMSARAAVEARTSETFESDYSFDEEQLLDVASELGVSGTDYSRWRADVLTRNIAIVTEPIVSKAILLVATCLEVEHSVGNRRGMSSKEVREHIRIVEMRNG